VIEALLADRGPTPETDTVLPVRSLEIFRRYVTSGGSQRNVAAHFGLSPQTVKNHLYALYQHLGVNSAMEAALVLGWVRVEPAPEVCGWTGYCGRPEGHRGHHGGFRAFRPGMRLNGE
jgi:DNA-binding CsgD family transcriptional regulator